MEEKIIVGNGNTLYNRAKAALPEEVPKNTGLEMSPIRGILTKSINTKLVNKIFELIDGYGNNNTYSIDKIIEEQLGIVTEEDLQKLQIRSSKTPNKKVFVTSRVVHYGLVDIAKSIKNETNDETRISRNTSLTELISFIYKYKGLILKRLSELS